MKPARIISYDLKNIFRDKMLGTMFVMVPLLFLGVIEYGLPWLESAFAIVRDYNRVIILFLLFQTAVLAGFIVGFVILDEKDSKTLRALFVTPLSGQLYFGYRLLLAAFISLVFSLFILLIAPPLFTARELIVICAFVASIATVFTLAISLLATNKVEGLTWFKGLNFVMVLPVISTFTDTAWTNILAVLPSWWLFNATRADEMAWSFPLYVAAGSLLLLTYNVVLYKKSLARSV